MRYADGVNGEDSFLKTESKGGIQLLKVVKIQQDAVCTDDETLVVRSFWL